MTAASSPSYIGRFAPTPSGHLHFGSLVAALASYLDARSAGGRWLLRMEDLDPPREMPGAQAAIIEALHRYGFEWDGEWIRQSDRHDAYAHVVERLFSQGLAYACTCSRKQLEGYNGVYPGFCRNAGHSMENAAIRVRVPNWNMPLRIASRVSTANTWAATWGISSSVAVTGFTPINWPSYSMMPPKV
jgi:glutamyl-Q tRNA(Asp) synthetase